MRHDLAAQTGPQSRDTHVAIIGGGIAGFILARQLAQARIPCILLESGGLVAQPRDPLYTDVTFRRRAYGGAIAGRSRGLGGTSVMWGGALLPFRDADFAPRRNPRMPDWPIRFSDLSAHVAQAERLFGLNHNPYEATPRMRPAASRAFVPREAKWPSFRNRNMTALFGDIAEGRGGVEIWLNATVRRFGVEGAALKNVTAFGPQGQTLTVGARHFVVCAGAIETTRLMLLLDTQTEGKAIAGRQHLGRYLQDHLSMPLGRIVTQSPARLNEKFAFRFEGSVMRSLRFEQGLAGETAGFVHVAPRTARATGFDALRDVMRSIQRRKPDLKAMLRALRDGPYLARLAWWRIVKRKLLWPSPAEYDVHVVIEQLADRDNRIALGERTDQLGDPVTEIDWDISPADIAAIREFSQAFREFWTASGLEAFGRLVMSGDISEAVRESASDIGGIYHPVGSTRMAATPEGGVVDADLCVFGLDNLHLGATSVFPNSGSANPTMTLILLILRLAKRLEAITAQSR